MKNLMLLAAGAPLAFMNDVVAAPAAAPAAPKAARVEPVIGGVMKLEMPVRTKRGSEPKYPFEALTEIGMAFGVKNKTAKDMASVISAANRRYTKPVLDGAGNPTYETKEVPNVVDGQPPMIVPDNTKPIKTVTAHFFAVDVDAAQKKAIKDTPLADSKVLVFRDK